VRRLGLDLGATNIKLALLDDDRLVATDQAPTRSEDGGPPAVLARMADLVDSAGPVDAVGVGLPGLFDEDGVAILLPNLFGDWTDQPVRAPLEDALGRRVRLINDGHAFALAESTLGAGAGARNVMCIVCGTGIGGGLVLDGRLHLGQAQRAGEFGHQTLTEDGPVCECGNRGCLELFAGARAIARAAGATTFEAALDAARDGDDRARAALERAGTLIGIALANVVIFLTPDRVVIGGGVAQAGHLLLEPIRASVADRARVAPLEQIEIVPAALGAFAGAIGAALWAATPAG
jgi:glucokinase